MKIIIAGAGNLGFHLAELLSYENQDIALIDDNQDVLDYASSRLDLLTLRGDSSSIRILNEAGAARADLVLATTTSESNNLLTASLAKKLGAKQVIARVLKTEYLAEENRELLKSMGVDSVFSPVRLAAKEIKRLVDRCTFTDIFEFEEGEISLYGITLDHHSPLVNVQLKNWRQMQIEPSLRPIAILRGYLTIIPTGEVTLKSNDHVYFITRKDKVSEMENFVGVKKVNINDIMILGGSPVAYETARLLEGTYNVTLIEENKERCKHLAEELQNTLIINGKSDNIDLLKEEGLGRMDAFIALTPNSETNIIASLTAKNNGVYKTIALVENKEYVFISQNIGVDTLINQKLIAANYIFRFVRKGKVEAIIGLHGMDAEIIEFVITRNNFLTRKPLKELHFPKLARIGGVIRDEKGIIPDGNFQLQLNDKVIVFAMPEAILKVEELFK